jgi:hypothetical protein
MPCLKAIQLLNIYYNTESLQSIYRPREAKAAAVALGQFVKPRQSCKAYKMGGNRRPVLSMRILMFL